MPCTKMCGRCALYSVCACKIGVWRSMSSLYHFSSTRSQISFRFPSLFHSIRFSELSCIENSAQCTLHIGNGKCWKAPARMHSNWWTRIEVSLYFPLQFQAFYFYIQSYAINHYRFVFCMPVMQQNHESESILQKFIFCILSFKYSFFALFAYRKLLYSLCSFIRSFCTFVISVPLSLSLSLTPRTSHISFTHHSYSRSNYFCNTTFTIYGNHDMIAQYAISTQDKPCV